MFADVSELTWVPLTESVFSFSAFWGSSSQDPERRSMLPSANDLVLARGFGTARNGNHFRPRWANFRLAKLAVALRVSASIIGDPESAELRRLLHPLGGHAR